jgi:molybdate transport system substrate-binding protein
MPDTGRSGSLSRQVKPFLLVLASALLVGCGSKPVAGELHIAAATNLQRVFDPLAKAFDKQTGVKVIASYGASTQLAQQIENGGPFDLFLSADTAQVDRLAAKGLLVDKSRSIYARGVLALWAPKSPAIQKLEDLKRPEVKRIGIANPELAPYGKAAIETLTALHFWPELESKAVYGPNISIVAKFAESANADASFTALSLVNDRLEKPIIVPENLHQPIDQALGIVKSTTHGEAAAEFRQFILGPEAQAIFGKFGYRSPQ